MGKTFNMVGGGGGLSPDLPIGSRINVTSDLGTTITASKGNLSYTKQINWDARLPSEYQEVAWIQSTGTQYLNTNVNQSTYASSLKIIADAKYVSTTQGAVLGGCGDGTNYCVLMSINASNKFYASYGTTNIVTTTTSDTNRHTFIIDKPNGRVNIDSSSTSFSSSVSLNMPIYIFGYNRAGTHMIVSGLSIQLFSLQMYDGETLIRDYIPCYRKADFVAGMYDLVNDTFYTNCATTGNDFIVGCPVRCLPIGYTQYEYLEATGTQYIDTRINATGDLRVTCEFKIPTGQSQARIYGRQDYATYANKRTLEYSSGSLYFGYGTQDLNTSVSTNVWINFDSNKNITTVTTNGSSSSRTATYSSFTSSTSMILFGFKGGTDVYPVGTKQIANFRVCNGTTLLLDYVPCTDSNNIAGMYDIVNGVFYDNDGTGTFTLGEQVTPSNGTCTFTTHYSGTWTVKAEKTGESPITDTVSVADDDTDYSVSLFWTYWLYNEGNEYTSRTGGWAILPNVGLGSWHGFGNPTFTKEANYLELSYASGSSAMSALCNIVNDISLLGFNTLKAELSLIVESGTPGFDISILNRNSSYYRTDAAANYYYSATSGTVAKTVYTLAFTGLSAYDLGIGLYHQAGQGSCTLRIHKVWLE